MLVMPVPETAFIDPFCREAHADDDLQHPGPAHEGGLHPRPAQRRPQGRQLHEVRPASPTPPTSARRWSSSSSTTSATTRPPHSATTSSISAEGAWNTGRDEKPNLGYKLRYKEGYFPCPPSDALHDLRTEMMLTMIECGLHVEAAPPRGGHRRPGRDRHALRRPGPDGRQRAEVQVRRQERGPQARQDGDVHAQAAVQGQRLGMHVHVSLWKNGENLFAGRSRRYARPVGHGRVRHRRAA